MDPRGGRCCDREHTACACRRPWPSIRRSVPAPPGTEKQCNERVGQMASETWCPCLSTMIWGHVDRRRGSGVGWANPRTGGQSRSSLHGERETGLLCAVLDAGPGSSEGAVGSLLPGRVLPGGPHESEDLALTQLPLRRRPRIQSPGCRHHGPRVSVRPGGSGRGVRSAPRGLSPRGEDVDLVSSGSCSTLASSEGQASSG